MTRRKKYLKRAFSKDQLRTFTWNKDVATVYPDFSFDAVLAMVDDDPIARGAVNHYVDKYMEGNYSVLKKDLSIDKSFEEQLNSKFNFRPVIVRKTGLVGKLYNNVFIEIVRDTKGVKGLNILDSSNVEPITETNGDPIKFKSRVANQETGEYAEWKKEDIVWIKFGDRCTGYAPVDMKALWENLLLKSYIKRYMGWLWQTGQYRVLYNIKSGASDKDITDFLTYARKNDNNFKAPFLLKGDMLTSMIRDIKENESIVGLLKYLDNQTLVLLRIPPNDAGIPDQSGRSNADQQSNNLTTHIISNHKLIEDAFSYDLFPKMNKGNNIFKFGPVDRFTTKQVIENVNLMKNMGMTEKFIKEYFNDSGIYFQTKKIFEDPLANQVKLQTQLAEVGADAPAANGPGTKKDINTMPSRQKSVDKGQIGTGSQGSTRDNQLKKM